MNNINIQNTISGQLGPEFTTIDQNPQVPTSVGTQTWKPPTSPDSLLPKAFPEPPQGAGVNNWVIRAFLSCKSMGMSEEQAAVKIKSFESRLHRPLRSDEISRALHKVYHTDGRKQWGGTKDRVPKWPTVDRAAQQLAIESSDVKTVADLISRSELVPGDYTADMVVDLLFPGNPLICLGGSPGEFKTDYRENLRGLDFTTLIVPSPMTSLEGMKQDGTGPSEHTLENTGDRRYLVCEFDGYLSRDSQAAISWHLSRYASLVCVCFSGNKSLHAWFLVEGQSEAEILKFFRYAVSLGADSATWSRCQFCRLPGGYNNDKDAKQEIYYLKAPVPVSMPKLPGGYDWTIRSGGEIWTKDPDAIQNLSAPPVIHGLIRQGDVGTLVGPAKTSKTWFAIKLALAVAGGAEFIGHKTHKRKTIYIDYELPEGSLKKRICMLSEESPNNFSYVTLRGVDPLPTFDQIEELVDSEGYEFIVLDSLYRTGLLTEENNNDSTSRELTRLQAFAARTGVTILVVDHTAKGGGTDRSAVDASRGASSKGGFFDFILVLRTFPKSGESMSTHVVLDPVVRDWPPPTKLPVLSFTWQNVSCAIELAGEAPVDDPQLKCGRLLDILTENGGPLTVANLHSCSGLPETTVRKCLDRLVEQGKIQCFPDPGHSQRRHYQVAPEEGAEPPGRSS